MSYDLRFYKPRPGLTLQETEDALEQEFESGTPNPAFAIDPHKVVELLCAAGLEFEDPVVDPEMTELNPVNHELAPIQISIDHTSVYVTLPNWDFSPQQIKAIQHYWDATFTVLTKEGLIGYDSQIDAEITQATFKQIIAGTAQSASALREFVGEKHKPWWKFW